MIRFLVALLTFLTTASAADKKVLCFIGHKTSHGFGNHEYHAGNHLIGEWLEKAYPGQIESRYSINWPENEEEFFKDADSVVFFCSGGGGHLVNKHVENFDKVMKTGTGLACLHYAVEVPIGPSAKGMLNWMGGYFEANWSVNPHWIAEFEVFPEHEAANGVKSFKADDEWYFHMRFREGMKGVTPILSAVAPDETMKRADGKHSGNPTVRKAVAAKDPQHVAWVYQRGADYKDGRGFGFTGLHYHWNWMDDSFRKTVLNGVAYTLKLPIPKDGVASERPTKAELEANALEYGGAQVRKPKQPRKRPAKKAAPKAATHAPADAVGGLTAHDDLNLQLFASEPMVLSPSSIDVDHKGRVWVCEIVNYRRHKGKRAEGDRIVVLEDTDGDGKADKSSVFYQGTDVDSAHGICVLGDRVIISAGDDVFSLYDRDGDGIADAGSKELMFTKIDGAQHDHGIHAFHFGPDGRLYFNFGNAGKALHDKDGKIVIDKAGNEVRAGNLPYQEGMVFRCELDGSGVETLGWNFRNNWEIAVDSFGTIWQTDNDDDGNKAVRVNYVMEFGNYGYKDEITKAGWRDARPNIEKEIPLRHWHLNDPGVVPNMLQTGAGSPSGLCIYEGDLLPKQFRGQLVHCEPGQNVVRAYLTKADGAGYSAETENVLTGTSDRWFRPSDVCVAPDGSLIVADWYDPGVGGHGMGDLDRGRIFRIAPESASKYGRIITDVSSIEGAIIALQSPNEEARFLAWQKLQSEGKNAEAALRKFFRDKESTPTLRARALWLLARLDKQNAIQALSDPNSDIRITAIRALRQLDPKDQTAAMVLKDDSNPQVRREVAIALRFLNDGNANKIWASLAAKHTPGDRWGLEALGIGADLHWDERLAATINPKPEIIWRSRGSNSTEQITELLVASNAAEAPKYFRALQFQKDKEATKKAYAIAFQKGGQESALLAASQLGSAAIEALPGGKERLDSLIAPLRGKPEFIQLAERLGLRSFGNEFLTYILENPETNEAVTAAKLLLGDRDPIYTVLHGKDLQAIDRLVTALGRTSDSSATGLLAWELKSEHSNAAARRSIVSALLISTQGCRDLIKLAKNGELREELKPIAALGLARSTDRGIREQAAKILPTPSAPGFPPIAELAKRNGDASKGKAAYTQAGCNACHRVGDQHIDFGPDLTEIGKKLSKEAMYEAILFPNTAISHGFHGITISQKNGAKVAGYITGETDTELTLRLPGGVSHKIPTKEINEREPMNDSLMPPGLAAAVGEEGLADLVAYLLSLRG